MFGRLAIETLINFTYAYSCCVAYGLVSDSRIPAELRGLSGEDYDNALMSWQASVEAKIEIHRRQQQKKEKEGRRRSGRTGVAYSRLRPRPVTCRRVAYLCNEETNMKQCDAIDVECTGGQWLGVSDGDWLSSTSADGNRSSGREEEETWLSCVPPWSSDDITSTSSCSTRCSRNSTSDSTSSSSHSSSLWWCGSEEEETWLSGEEKGKEEESMDWGGEKQRQDMVGEREMEALAARAARAAVTESSHPIPPPSTGIAVRKAAVPASKKKGTKVSGWATANRQQARSVARSSPVMTAVSPSSSQPRSSAAAVSAAAAAASRPSGTRQWKAGGSAAVRKAAGVVKSEACAAASNMVATKSLTAKKEGNKMPTAQSLAQQSVCCITWPPCQGDGMRMVHGSKSPELLATAAQGAKAAAIVMGGRQRAVSEEEKARREARRERAAAALRESHKWEKERWNSGMACVRLSILRSKRTGSL